MRVATYGNHGFNSKISNCRNKSGYNIIFVFSVSILILRLLFMLMPFLRDKGECVKYFRNHTRMIIITYVNLSQLINAY
jgi:hypothetical protein